MALTSFNGGEASVWDSGSGTIRDAEGATGTSGVATAAGALRAGSTGSRHQLMDLSVSGANAVITTRAIANNGAGATTIAIHLVAQIDNVTGDGTTYDDIFITDSGGGRHFFVCYARKADGKLHLLVDLEAVSAVVNNGSGKARFTLTNSTTGWTTGDTIFSEVRGYLGFTTITVIDGTHVDTTFAFVATGTGSTYWEVNPANAFTPTFGAAFGLRIEVGVSAPYLAEMYYDSTAGGTFVKQQSANAPKAIGSFSNVSLGKNIGKGNNHNWKFSCDDVYVQDNGGSFNNTLVREYRDVVMARRPAAGTQQYNETGFQNTSSVTCNSTACYTDVADTNDGTYVKFVGDPGHVGGLQFYHITFPTIGSVPQVNDTVYAALVSARGIDKSASAPGYGGWWYYNGTGAILAGYTAGPTTVGWTACSGDDHAPDGTAWTPAAIAQTQIGVAPAVADTATYNLQYTELYFTLLYKQGTVGKIVEVNQAVNRAANY